MRSPDLFRIGSRSRKHKHAQLRGYALTSGHSRLRDAHRGSARLRTSCATIPARSADSCDDRQRPS